MSEIKYKRILLKLSGEALLGKAKYGIDETRLDRIAAEIAEIKELGVEVGIVLGAGNIFRGIKGASQGMDRAAADYMGMLATIMNAIALQHALEKHACHTRVMSALPMQSVVEPFIRQRAVHHLNRGYVVIFAAGTGLPYFTTDTAGALRAAEVGAEVVMKATKVNGVYDSNPDDNPHARLYETLTFAEVMAQNLRVMDLSAVSLCRDNGIPILVFNLLKEGNIKRAVQGENVGTLIKE